VAERTQFKSPPKAHAEFDTNGGRSDYIFSIVPDLDLSTKTALYINFNDEFLPQLSIHNPYTYLDMNGIRTKIKVYNQAPRTMKLTGWTSTILNQTNMTFTMIGLSTPASSNKREFQFILGDEESYYAFFEWGKSDIIAPPLLNSTALIYLDDISYNILTIRENTKVSLRFKSTIDIGFNTKTGNWTGVYFNYIKEEITRTFKPLCKLSTDVSSVNLIGDSCNMVGHRMEMQLIANLTKDTIYKLEIDDVPNPDYGYVDIVPLTLVFTTSDRKTVMASSTNMIFNYLPTQFTKLTENQLLNYDNLSNGIIEVPRGFYTIVYIAPQVTTGVGESQYYLDKTTFALGSSNDKSLISNTVGIWGINNFVSEIGSDNCPFVIGA
jgi:hypothetical protein